MKIKKIKPFTDHVMNVIFGIWAVVLISYVFVFQEGLNDPLGFGCALAIWVGLLINVLIYFRYKRECDQGKHYLQIEADKILYHGSGLFGRERMVVVVEFDNFHTFSVEKTWLFGEAIFINTIIGGKRKILFSGEVYEKTSKEILEIIQKAQEEKSGK